MHRHFFFIPRINWFIGLFGLISLFNQRAQAQTFQGIATLTAVPAPLLVSVRPVPNTALLRVRYQVRQAEPVQIQIRNERGEVMYEERIRQAAYVGDFDLTAWPTGLYTFELRTATDHRRETVRVMQRSPVVVTLATPAPDTLYFSQPIRSL